MPDVYEALRERLDKFPQGFPRSPSGVEIEILKRLFSPHEAEIALCLKPFPELPESVAARLDGDREGIGTILYDMSRRGLILRVRIQEALYYGLVPWMMGIWEFQLKRLDQDNIHLYERYFEEGLVPYKKQARLSGARVLPVEEEVCEFQEIEPYEKVSEIVASHTLFAVADCICRTERAMQGKGCGKLTEACLMFGPAAEYYIENGLGRAITREEAAAILKQAEREGLVHISSNHRGVKGFICNCCGCCCKALEVIVRHGHAAAITTANYRAEIDTALCTGCEACLERCQTRAISMEDEAARLDASRCLGCGLCVSTCPAGAVRLVRKPAHEHTRVFADAFESNRVIGETWGKPFPFE